MKTYFGTIEEVGVKFKDYEGNLLMTIGNNGFVGFSLITKDWVNAIVLEPSKSPQTPQSRFVTGNLVAVVSSEFVLISD